MTDITSKCRQYSIMFMATALFHFYSLVIFGVNKCAVPALFNGVLMLCYLYIAWKVRKTKRTLKFYIIGGSLMLAHILFHQLLLGPEFGYQYLFFGAIPALFYLCYMGERTFKQTIITAIAGGVVFVLVSCICLFMSYPIYELGPISEFMIIGANIMTAYHFALSFMVLLMKQANFDKGSLENRFENLKTSADIDPLTGLKNRRSFDYFMKKVMSAAKGEGKDFTVLIGDIDNFKKVNDTYGHDCGDIVLKKIAEILDKEVRAEDMVFRWGGEEFLIIICNQGFIAKKVAERCRTAIEEQEIAWRGTNIKVTITIGGMPYYQGATVDELIKRADENLYIGKNSGKNQVVF